jgi:simple sugar transport system permease protein
LFPWLRKVLANISLPHLIIVAFFLILLCSAAPLGLSIPSLISDTLRRWAMYGILVLAMVPAIQSGIGPNFGISLGIVGGLLGATISIEMGLTNPWAAVAVAMAIGGAIASVLGILYGLLLNRVKGSEMTVSTYVGFSVIAFMNIMWLSLPFSKGTLIWPLGGMGMRNNISLVDSFGHVFNNWFSFHLFGGEETGIFVPTGLIIVFLASCLLMGLFLRSKTGIAMSAAGENPAFTRAAGINVDKMRIIGTAISTALGAIGIIVYAQSYGFLQLYNAPLMMGFHCVAAILIGGASTKKATIANVLVGTFLFQGILAVALPVVNKILPESNLSDVIRIIISNGIILFALSKAKGGEVSG